MMHLQNSYDVFSFGANLRAITMLSSQNCTLWVVVSKAMVIMTLIIIMKNHKHLQKYYTVNHCTLRPMFTGDGS